METTNEQNSTKLIVDVSSGTIVSLKDCRIIQADQLPVHHDLSDGEVSELAEKVGVPVDGSVFDNNYTEEQARDLVARLSTQFGWKTFVFTPELITDTWDEVTGKTITPEQMAKVKATRMWVKGLDDAVCREAMEYLYETVSEMAEEDGVI